MPSSLFIGREHERSQIVTQLDHARNGHGGVVLLAGDPGIGKTRLASEIAEQAAKIGQVYWGRCWEGEGAPSLWPWLQILRAVVVSSSDADLAEFVGRGAAEIADLLPEVRERLPDTPESPPLEPAQARFRVLDSLSSFFKRVAAVRPLVLILDDLHCADELALQLMQLIARSARLSPLLILGTYRSMEARRNPAAARLLESIAREATRFGLTGLNLTQVRQYLRDTLSTPPASSLVSAVHARTEGNPLFLGEIARILRATPLRPAESFEPPKEVYAAIARHLEELSPATHRCLRVAAVIGREFDVGLLGKLLVGEVEIDVETSLKEAAAADVVAELPNRPNRFRFAHELVRETLYRAQSDSERRALHRRIADQMESAGASDPDEYFPAVAGHFCAAAGGEYDGKAIEYAIRAARQASRRHRHEDAVRHYRSALTVLGNASETEPRRLEILMACGHAYWWAGQPENARAVFADVTDCVRRQLADPARPQAPQQFAEAVLGFGGAGLGGAGATGAPNQRLLELIEEGLIVIGNADSPMRSRLLARMGVAMAVATDVERRVRSVRESIAVARRIGDHATLANALLQSHWGGWVPENVQERLANAGELIALADELGNRQIALAARSFRVYDLIETGDLPTATREIQVHATLAEQLRHPFHLYCVLRIRTLRAMMEGRLNEAEVLAEETLAAGERVDEWISTTTQIGQRVLLALFRGRAHEVEALLEESIRRYPGLPTFENVLAIVHCRTGRLQAARRLLELLVADDFALVARGFTWPFSMAILAEVCVELGDSVRAAQLYERLMPHAEGIVMVGAVGLYGAMGRFLGQLAELLERPEEAARHFERAHALDARVGSRPTLALSQHAYARFLAKGSESQRRRSRELIEAALESAREMGMEGLVREALELRRQLDANRPAASPQAPPANVFRKSGTGWKIEFGGKSVEIKDRRGLRYIAELLREPGRDCHVADLVALGSSTANTERHAFPITRAEGTAATDRQALAAYRARLADLRDELDEADEANDLGRAARLRSEIAAISEELAQSFTMHSRSAVDTVEKMRKAVLAAIRNALPDIESAHEELGRHLRQAIVTGISCAYRPAPPVSWLVMTDPTSSP